MSMQPPTPKPEFLTPDEKPLIVQHEEIKARAKELDKKFAEVVEAHGDLSEIEAALALINQEREILKEKKELRYARVKEFLLAGFDYIAGPEDLISELKEDLVPFLIKALGDENWIVRSNAASAFSWIDPDDEKAVPALVGALRDKVAGVRNCAAGVLGGFGQYAVPALINALGDENEDVRKCAVIALREIGSDAIEAVPNLIKALRDKFDEVRSNAADALIEIGFKNPTVIKQLEEMAVREKNNSRKEIVLHVLKILKGASEI